MVKENVRALVEDQLAIDLIFPSAWHGDSGVMDFLSQCGARAGRDLHLREIDQFKADSGVPRSFWQADGRNGDMCANPPSTGQGASWCSRTDRA